jgi:hypothetical protein
MPPQVGPDIRAGRLRRRWKAPKDCITCYERLGWVWGVITRTCGGRGAAPSALDGHVLTFGDSGSALYTAMRIPVSLNLTLLILESDEDVVELGRRIDTEVDGKDFDIFASSVLTLLATAATPQLTAAAAIAKFVSRAIPQVLVRNRDDQVGLYSLSLNRMEHYPNGERKRDDVPDLTNNVRVDYSIFSTTYTV